MNTGKDATFELDGRFLSLKLWFWSGVVFNFGFLWGKKGKVEMLQEIKVDLEIIVVNKRVKDWLSYSSRLLLWLFKECKQCQLSKEDGKLGMKKEEN